MDGVFAIPASVTEAGRVSSASAYLTPAVRRRPNLRILAEAEVTRIQFEGQTAVGALVRRADGSMETIRARETIVSAGAIHSPALLMKSGVGPAAQLAECGIAVVADSPSVGSNLQNHLFVHLGAVVRREARHDPAMRRYVLAGARISSRLGNTPEGDIFIAFMSRTSGHATGNHLGMLAAALYAPFSRGTVRLDRTNPQGPPVVDFNLLDDPRDTSRMIEAARFARALLRHPEVVAVTTEPFILPPNPPIRLLSRPGLRSRLLNDLIAATLSLGAPLRRAVLRHALAPGKLLRHRFRRRGCDAVESLLRAAIAGSSAIRRPQHSIAVICSCQVTRGASASRGRSASRCCCRGRYQPCPRLHGDARGDALREPANTIIFHTDAMALGGARRSPRWD